MIAIFLIGFSCWFWCRIIAHLRQNENNQTRDWDIEYARLKVESPAVYAELEAQKAARRAAQVAQDRRNRRDALLALLGGSALFTLAAILWHLFY